MDGFDGGGYAMRWDRVRSSEVGTRTRWKMEGDLGDSGWGLGSSSQRLWMSLKDEQEKGGGFDLVWILLGVLIHGAHMKERQRKRSKYGVGKKGEGMAYSGPLGLINKGVSLFVRKG